MAVTLGEEATQEVVEEDIQGEEEVGVTLGEEEEERETDFLQARMPRRSVHRSARMVPHLVAAAVEEGHTVHLRHLARTVPHRAVEEGHMEYLNHPALTAGHLVAEVEEGHMVPLRRHTVPLRHHTVLQRHLAHTEDHLVVAEGEEVGRTVPQRQLHLAHTAVEEEVSVQLPLLSSTSCINSYFAYPSFQLRPLDPIFSCTRRFHFIAFLQWRTLLKRCTIFNLVSKSYLTPEQSVNAVSIDML